jgi:hypothetical protein
MKMIDSIAHKSSALPERGIFDVSLSSCILLPELPEISGGIHVSSRVSFHLCLTEQATLPEPCWIRTACLPNGRVTVRLGRRLDRLWLRFPDVADFEIRTQGSQITCYARPNVPIVSIRHLLLDQVVPRFLSHLGRPVIHGSCVRIRDGAIGFLGGTGRGKSTLGSYFHKRGFELLCDDGFLIEQGRGGVVVIPGYPGARLWKDSIAALSVSGRSLPVAHYCSKERVLLDRKDENFAPARVPIRALFVLGDPRSSTESPPVSISRITGSRAVAELLQSSFNLDMSDPSTAARHFATLGAIAANTKLSLSYLCYPRGYDELPDVVDAVLAYLDIA